MNELLFIILHIFYKKDINWLISYIFLGLKWKNKFFFLSDDFLKNNNKKEEK